MSELFKLTITALFELKPVELDSVVHVAETLRVRAGYAPGGRAGTSPIQALGAAKHEYQKARAAAGLPLMAPTSMAVKPEAKLDQHVSVEHITQVTTVKPARKPRTGQYKRKDFDPKEVLKAKKGGYGNVHGKAGGKPAVWPTVRAGLTQTSGKISGRELAEVLGIRTHQATSALSNAFKRKEPHLKREPTKTTLENGKVVPEYLYWLEG